MLSDSHYAEAQGYVKQYLIHVRTDLDRLLMYSRWVRCKTGMTDPVGAIEVGVEGLRVAKIAITMDEEEAKVQAERLLPLVLVSEDKIEVRLGLY